MLEKLSSLRPRYRLLACLPALRRLAYMSNLVPVYTRSLTRRASSAQAALNHLKAAHTSCLQDSCNPPAQRTFARPQPSPPRPSVPSRAVKPLFFSQVRSFHSTNSTHPLLHILPSGYPDVIQLLVTEASSDQNLGQGPSEKLLGLSNLLCAQHHPLQSFMLQDKGPFQRFKRKSPQDGGGQRGR